MEIITVSDRAQTQLRRICADPADYFCISVKSGGCAGYKYVFSTTKYPDDKSIIIRGVGFNLAIDPISELYIIGSELDWIDDKFESRFVFVNPNIKNKCGCDKSFGL